MRRIAVTGISGYLGTRLLQRLEQERDVERVIGIDRRPPPSGSSKLTFCARDVSEPFADVFLEYNVDSAIHLAFAVRPTHDTKAARRIDIGGAEHFLKACQEASVQALLYLSSHTAYGPHPDNPVPITEDAPLRPIQSFQYSWDKGEADRLFQRFMHDHPDKAVTIVRACSILGPTGRGSVSTGMFQAVMIRLAGYDPLIQFLHEEDLANVLATLILRKQAGIYNAGGEGALPYSEIVALTGKPSITIPAGLLSGLLKVTWRLKLQSQSPPGGVEFLKYPIVLSTERLTKTAGVPIRYSTRETLTAYLDAVRGRRA